MNLILWRLGINSEALSSSLSPERGEEEFHTSKLAHCHCVEFLVPTKEKLQFTSFINEQEQVAIISYLQPIRFLY